MAKASYFLSTSKAGSHSFVFGADVFDDKRFSNNHQSGSDYRDLRDLGHPPRGRHLPGLRQSDLHPAGTRSSRGARATASGRSPFYANDSWTLGKRWRFNLGLRYDKNDGKDSVGTTVVKDSAWSPRLSATFDPRGDGAVDGQRVLRQVRGGDRQRGRRQPRRAGNPATIEYDYLGPAVNVGNPANPVGAADALQTLFGWFNANGGTNRRPRGTPAIPGLTARISDSLASPNVQELTLGITRRLGARGLVRVDGIYRQFHDFYAFELNPGTGTVTDPYGKVYDLGIHREHQRRASGSTRG